MSDREQKNKSGRDYVPFAENSYLYEGEQDDTAVEDAAEHNTSGEPENGGSAEKLPGSPARAGEGSRPEKDPEKRENTEEATSTGAFGDKKDPREISEDEAATGGKENGRPAPDLDYNDLDIRVSPVEYASSGSRAETKEEKNGKGFLIRKRKEPENTESADLEELQEKHSGGSDAAEKDLAAHDLDALNPDDADFDDEDLNDTGKEKLPLSVRFRRFRERMPISLKTQSYLVIISLVLAVAILATLINYFWRYSDFEVISTRAQEDTASFDYCNVGGDILRYGAEGATLYDRQNEDLWDISYTMDSPAAVVNGDVFAIYDQAGTSVVVCDQSGKKGTINTSYPVVKAAVNPEGMVATIQESGSVTWIEYYSYDGTKIAEMRTSIEDPGYPMDLCVSGDGTLLGVTYLRYQDGLQVGSVDFYNFGSSGQNQMDNRVAEFTFSGRILPEIDYLTDTSCVAFRDNGFTVYSGGMIPEQTADVTVDGDIVSVFYDSSHIGLVLAGDADNTFELQLYNSSGRKIMHRELNFSYNTVELVDQHINFYGTSSLNVFTLSGVCKFSGDYGESTRELFATGAYRYVVVTDKDMELIRLK